MANNSRCGLTEEERKRFLRDCGFTFKSKGRGSHENWEHEDLKMIARSLSIFPPANLLSNPAQKPWEITLCGDPAPGTWHKVGKLAKWCAEQTQELKSVAQAENRQQTSQKFKENTEEVCRKKFIQQCLRAGMSVQDIPKFPAHP
jgi:hypothetical protein